MKRKTRNKILKKWASFKNLFKRKPKPAAKTEPKTKKKKKWLKRILIIAGILFILAFVVPWLWQLFCQIVSWLFNSVIKLIVIVICVVGFFLAIDKD